MQTRLLGFAIRTLVVAALLWSSGIVQPSPFSTEKLLEGFWMNRAKRFLACKSRSTVPR